MKLTFLGKESVPDQSPTLYSTDNDTYVVQGWIVTDSDIVSLIAVTDNETIVEIPPNLMVYLAKDGLVGDITNLAPPIVHVLDSGNYIVKGGRVTNIEALSQMFIPDHETCVEISRSAVAALIGG